MALHYALPERSNCSQPGQYQISADGTLLHTRWKCKLVNTTLSIKLVGWNVITHPLRVQIWGNEVSIKLATNGMALRTSWEFKLVDTKSALN